MSISIRITVMCLLLSISLDLPTTASAAEDAGTRSVFAQGAGSRALAMGGAFVAIADDATATMWNPGGLGRIPRLEVEASQTSFFNLDISESYLAVVKPDWRWGAASLVLRHFGTGGIEGRDERNTLLSEDLSDSQTEVSLGYGRPMGEAWTLGGTIKARHQSLAGLSANGFGVDIGLQGQPGLFLGDRFPWLHNVTAGVALSNLIRPGMRLNGETVSDPLGTRLGFAYAHPLSGYRSLLFAFDFEKATNVATRFHTGVELRVHPQLALRAGLRKGGMTAGTGVQWRDLSMDYTFEGNPLGDVHRLGFTYAIGPTVSDSRTAALRAEEEAIRERMNDAFQKRQADQIATLLQQAEASHGAGRTDEALDVLSTVLTLDPERDEVRSRMVAWQTEKAARFEAAGDYAQAVVTYGRALALAPDDTTAASGEQRCQAASDERAERSAELRRQFRAAMDAFASDDLLKARRGFGDIVAADSTDEDAAAMLDRTRQAIARRVRNLLDQAGRYVLRNLLDEAGELLVQVRTVDPRTPQLAAAEASLARARQRAREVSQASRATTTARGPKLPTPASPAALTAKQKKELEFLYKRGLQAMSQHRSDDAIRYWEMVWKESHDFQNVAEYLKRECLARGMEAFAAGQLEEAVSFWERVLQIDPSNERAQGYLVRAGKQIERSREILGVNP